MNQKTITPALAHIDQLPSTAMMRPKPSAMYLGISIASLWRLIQKGHIKSFKITERTTGIRVGDLRAYMANREGV